MISKYSEKMILPETQAKMPRVNTIIAEVPAARPSIPSVRFAPFETAVIIIMLTRMKMIHAYFSKSGLIQVIKSE